MVELCLSAVSFPMKLRHVDSPIITESAINGEESPGMYSCRPIYSIETLKGVVINSIWVPIKNSGSSNGVGLGLYF